MSAEFVFVIRYWRRRVLSDTASSSRSWSISIRWVGSSSKAFREDPIQGNPSPRLWETRGGMINSVGLQNVGVRAFIADKLPGLRRYSTPVIANVFGYAAEDYVEVVHALNDAEGVAAYELNVSCPNTKHGGLAFGVDEAALADLVGRVKGVAKRPVIVKLSPNVATIEPFARSRNKTGPMRFRWSTHSSPWQSIAKSRRPRIGAGYGGFVRPGDQADRTAYGRAGGKSRENTRDRNGRNCDRRRRGGIHDCRRLVGRSRDGDILGSAATVKIARNSEKLLPKLGVDSVRNLVGTLEKGSIP